MNFNFPLYPPQLVCVFVTQGTFYTTHIIVKVINLLQSCLQSQFSQCIYIAHRLKL